MVSYGLKMSGRLRLLVQRQRRSGNGQMAMGQTALSQNHLTLDSR